MFESLKNLELKIIKSLKNGKKSEFRKFEHNILLKSKVLTFSTKTKRKNSSMKLRL